MAACSLAYPCCRCAPHAKRSTAHLVRVRGRVKVRVRIRARANPMRHAKHPVDGAPLRRLRSVIGAQDGLEARHAHLAHLVRVRARVGVGVGVGIGVRV